MNFICIDFINSSWYSSHREYEALEDIKWFKAFKEKWNIELSDMPDSKSKIELLELRKLLINSLEDIKTGGRLPVEALESLNHYLSMGTFSRKAVTAENGYRIVKVPVNQDWMWVESEIAASFIDLISKYETERIKHCENPECKWVFYDESKSRTRRWCDDTCGSLMKVRRFRERKKNVK